MGFAGFSLNQLLHFGFNESFTALHQTAIYELRDAEFSLKLYCSSGCSAKKSKKESRNLWFVRF